MHFVRSALLALPILLTFVAAAPNPSILTKGLSTLGKDGAKAVEKKAATPAASRSLSSAAKHVESAKIPSAPKKGAAPATSHRSTDQTALGKSTRSERNASRKAEDRA